MKCKKALVHRPEAFTGHKCNACEQEEKENALQGLSWMGTNPTPNIQDMLPMLQENEEEYKMNQWFKKEILKELETITGEFTASQIRDKIINRTGYRVMLGNTTQVAAFLRVKEANCISLKKGKWQKKEEMVV